MSEWTFEKIIGDAASVAIAGHVRPDGDCVGSCMGVYNYMRTNFPEVRAQVYLEPIPDSYLFLANTDQVRVPGEDEPVYDLFICLDCGDIKRLGPSGGLFESAKRTFCVDHHMAEHDFADGNYVKPKASSTSELLCELMDMDKITKETAECLYTGIVDDTGVFQYDCTSSKTMRIAGELIDKGVHFSSLIERVFYEKTYAQNRILAVALLSAKLHENGRIISTWLSKETMDEYGVKAIDTEGIVEQLRTTRGVDAAIFLHENEDGTYKGSLRTSADINLVNIAKLFGGGGHAKAAGFTATGDPETEIIPKILSALDQEFASL
ncbi:MAG: DHH family phosphoesterase [Lachnospiraceae bacterium]|nr:DHH family phosphoesterase [Lachnospiraceae bacterium]